MIERMVKRSKKKNNEDKDNERNKKRLESPLELGGEKYLDISQIKGKARKILSLAKDGDKITGKDSDFLRDLILQRDTGKEKLKDFEHFTVGTPPEFNYSRCFIIVKKDGSKDDFSVNKCVEAIEKKIRINNL